LNPRTPNKFGWGLVFLGLGFVVMGIASDRAQGGMLVSPLWLIAVYLMHTWGELFLSPIGLSMITKLAPVKIVSAMMGIWMGSIAVGNFLAAMMEKIVHHFDFPLFYFIAVEAIIAGLVAFAVAPLLSKMMKGIH
jgi:POT family proton-dependent oligopeptide transporter